MSLCRPGSARRVATGVCSNPVSGGRGVSGVHRRLLVRHRPQCPRRCVRAHGVFHSLLSCMHCVFTIHCYRACAVCISFIVIVRVLYVFHSLLSCVCCVGSVCIGKCLSVPCFCFYTNFCLLWDVHRARSQEFCSEGGRIQVFPMGKVGKVCVFSMGRCVCSQWGKCMFSQWKRYACSCPWCADPDLMVRRDGFRCLTSTVGNVYSSAMHCIVIGSSKLSRCVHKPDDNAKNTTACFESRLLKYSQCLVGVRLGSTAALWE